jgi:hypothetical protein
VQAAARYACGRRRQRRAAHLCGVAADAAAQLEDGWRLQQLGQGRRHGVAVPHVQHQAAAALGQGGQRLRSGGPQAWRQLHWHCCLAELPEGGGGDREGELYDGHRLLLIACIEYGAPFGVEAN